MLEVTWHNIFFLRFDITKTNFHMMLYWKRTYKLQYIFPIWQYFIRTMLHNPIGPCSVIQRFVDNTLCSVYMTCDTVCGHKYESHIYMYTLMQVKYFVYLTKLTLSFKFLFLFIKKKNTKNNLTERYICWLLFGLETR